MWNEVEWPMLFHRRKFPIRLGNLVEAECLKSQRDLPDEIDSGRDEHDGPWLTLSKRIP